MYIEGVAHKATFTYDQWEEDTDQCAKMNRNDRTLSSVFYEVF